MKTKVYIFETRYFLDMVFENECGVLAYTQGNGNNYESHKKKDIETFIYDYFIQDSRVEYKKTFLGYL